MVVYLHVISGSFGTVTAKLSNFASASVWIMSPETQVIWPYIEKA